MIISHKKRFIFLHIPKTAGTSLRNAFSKFDIPSFKEISFFDKLKIITKFYPRIYSSGHHWHVTAKELRERIDPKIFDSYFKFAFVRNPWDWQVSFYHYVLEDKSHYQHQLYCYFKNFDEYIRWRVKYEPILQLDLITDHKGKIIVDYIGKFENINEDINKISNKLNLGMVKMPHLKSSNRKRYQDYYDDETRDMVATTFKRDIEQFGYEF